jgi:hypothetical protein
VTETVADQSEQTPAETAPTPRSRWSENWARWGPSVWTGLWTWLAGLAMYTVVTFVAWVPYQDLVDHTLVTGTSPPPASAAEAYRIWHQWDTVWYVIIADSGYTYDERSTAFFPLYPLLIRGVGTVLPIGTFEAALLISVLACLAALILVHRLFAEVAGPVLANRGTFYLLAFPTGFYLAAAYNESLFIALVAASLYCMRRGEWVWAGMWAGYASATRLAGVLLAVAFAYEYLRQAGFSIRRIRFDALGIALVPAGVALYAWYCSRTFGDPLHFLSAQRHWFRDGYQAPWTTVWEVANLIGESPPLLGPDTVRNIINLGSALAVLVLLVLAMVGPWRIGRDQAYLVIFSAMVITLPLVSPIRHFFPLSSTWRFVLECLPVFLVLARMGRDRRFDRIYLATALALQGVMIVAFLQGRFVA